MKFISRSFAKCLLCREAIPSTNNEVVQAHFRNHHRANFNVDFLFKSSFLDENEILKTLDFIVSLIPSTITNKEPPTKDNIVHSDHPSELIEGITYEQNDSKDISSDGLLYNTIEDLDMFPSKSEDKQGILLIREIHKPENSDERVSIKNKSVESLNVAKVIDVTIPTKELDEIVNEVGDVVFQSLDNRKKICHICNKEVIGGQTKLTEHLKNHKKSICKYCNKISALQNLKRHLKICKKEKIRLICTICNFKASDRIDLQKHFKNMHYIDLELV